MFTRCGISRECAVLTGTHLLLMLKSTLCYPTKFLYHLMYPVITDDLPQSQGKENDKGVCTLKTVQNHIRVPQE